MGQLGFVSRGEGARSRPQGHILEFMSAWLAANFEPLLLELRTKQSEVKADEAEWDSILSRLGDLEVNATTRAMFQRFVDGQMTIKELDAAIADYLRQRGREESAGD